MTPAGTPTHRPREGVSEYRVVNGGAPTFVNVVASRLRGRAGEDLRDLLLLKDVTIERLKSIDAATLVGALQDAVDGAPPLAPGLAERLLAEFARGGVHPQPARPSQPQGRESEPAVITPRQKEILQLVAEGLSHKEIGRRIYITPRTLKYHMAEIMRKLHLDNRAQVLAYAARHASGAEPGRRPLP